MLFHLFLSKFTVCRSWFDGCTVFAFLIFSWLLCRFWFWKVEGIWGWCCPFLDWRILVFIFYQQEDFSTLSHPSVSFVTCRSPISWLQPSSMLQLFLPFYWEYPKKMFFFCIRLLAVKVFRPPLCLANLLWQPLWAALLPIRGSEKQVGGRTGWTTLDLEWQEARSVEWCNTIWWCVDAQVLCWLIAVSCFSIAIQTIFSLFS